ncbi:putative lipoprotein [Pseudomonas aeruginosa]|nr:putative lipoprotein [Pseudomonas aeruginosa]AWF00979.1 putative lipoprotein [Pseudomonas aeruginosa]RCG86181.1 putative lipoprotein [Pseudomonas aeruginosa]
MPARLQDGAARHRLVHAGAATMALPWALAFRNKARTR